MSDVRGVIAEKEIRLGPCRHGKEIWRLGTALLRAQARSSRASGTRRLGRRDARWRDDEGDGHGDAWLCGMSG